MLCRSTYFTAEFPLVSERLASRESAVGGSYDGARRKHTPGKEGDMRRITALILVLVAMATAAAMPLAASANHGGVHGDSAVRAM
jgi:hypothetical protein